MISRGSVGVLACIRRGVSPDGVSVIKSRPAIESQKPAVREARRLQARRLHYAFELRSKPAVLTPTNHKCENSPFVYCSGLARNVRL